MATYTITTTQNLDQLADPAGTADHTFNINGGTLVIDTDSRYNARFTAPTGTIGPVTISSTLGGSFQISGTNVRLIPFNSGTSGNVPAIGTTISQGGVSATLLGVWSNLASPPTAAGAAMPTSGFIKIKNKTGGNFAAGALTGIGASASAADVTGWIEVAASDTRSLTVPRLGDVTITGSWFTVIGTNGAAITTSGSANQTIQLPASLANTFYGGVWIETAPGSNVYEQYISALTLTNTGAGTDLFRGRIVWISSQGLLRIGSDGTNTVGYVPPAGCRIRVPNILLTNTTIASPTTNAAPNATLTTRYRTLTNNGQISVSGVNSGWYFTLANPFSVSVLNSSILSQLNISNPSTAIILNNLIVGLSDTSTVTSGVSVALSSGTVTDISAGTLDGNQNPFSLVTCSGLTLTRCRGVILNPRTSTRTAFNLSQACSNCTLIDAQALNAAISLTGNNLTIRNTSYADVLGGTTGTTNPQTAITIAGERVTVDGLNVPVTNTHPYNIFINVGTSNNTIIRNIATSAAPLSLGSSNATGQFVQIGSSNRTAIQRCFVTGTPRARLLTLAASVFGVTVENLWADSAIQLLQGSAQNPNECLLKGCYGNATPATSSTNTTDTIFWDAFTSATQGQIGIYFNEAVVFASVVSTTGSARFTGTGTLYMPAVNDSATFEFPYWILGYTSLANIAPTLTGGTGVAGRVTIEYQLNKNDGNGWTAYKVATAANLSGEGAVSPTNGFKLRFRFTITGADAANNTLTGYRIQGVTNATDQLATYPLNNYPIAVSGLAATANTAVRFISNLALLVSGQSDGSGVFTGTFSTDTDYTIPVGVRIRSRKTGFYPVELTDEISNAGINAIAVVLANPFSTGAGASVTGVSVTTSGNVATGITISQSRSFTQVADYLFDFENNNLAIDEFLTYDGQTLNPTCNVTVASGGNLTGTQTLAITGSRTLTLGTAQTYSFAISTQSTSTIVVQPGTTAITGIFAPGTTINRVSGSATVQVPASQISNLVAGTGVTITAPQPTVTFTNIPVTGSELRIYNPDTDPDSDLAGIENSTLSTHALSYTPGLFSNVRVQVLFPPGTFEEINLTVPANVDQTISVGGIAIADRNFFDPVN